MSEPMIDFLLLNVPMLLFIGLGVFIFTRSHQDAISRLTGVSAFCYATGFLGEYLRHMLSPTWDSSITKFVVAIHLLAMTMVLHSIYQIIEQKKKTNRRFAPGIFYVPFIVLVGYAIFYTKLETALLYKQGYRIYSAYPSFYSLGYVLSGVILSLLVGVLLIGFRRSITTNLKNMFRFFLVGTAGVVGLFFYLEVVLAPTILLFSTRMLIPMSLLVVIATICFVKYRVAPSFANRYQLLLDLTPVAVVVYNEDLRLKEANKLAQNMMPMVKKGTYFYDLYKDETHLFIMKRFIRMLEEEKAVSDYSLTFNEHTSEEMHVEVDAAIIREGYKKLYYFMIRDVTKAVIQERKNYDLAYYDQLTGLYNRAYFIPFVTNKLKQKKLSVVVLSDLNFFKQINDTYGHGVGDEVLRFTADLIQATVGDKCTIARLGGDEFVMYFSKIEYELVFEYWLEELRRAFQTHLFTTDELSIEVVPSFGYAVYPKDGMYFEKLIHQADLNMYEDKKRIKAKYNAVVEEHSEKTMY